MLIGFHSSEDRALKADQSLIDLIMELKADRPEI
jgi:hypothetical protein